MERYAYPIIAVSAVMLVYFLVSNNFTVESSIAQTNNQTGELYVIGNALENVKPDKANIILTLETESETASQAVSNNSAIMNKVISRLNALGIEEENISTNYYNVYPVYAPVRDDKVCITIYPPPPECFEQRIRGYKVVNSLTVTVDIKTNIGMIIDESVKSGINRVDSVYFFVSDELSNKVTNELIEKAVKDAKTKAEIALKPLNMNIIGVKNISVNTYPIYYPHQAVRYAASDIQTTPIFPSEQQIVISVNVNFQVG